MSRLNHRNFYKLLQEQPFLLPCLYHTRTHTLNFLKVPGPSSPAVMWLMAALRPGGEAICWKINDVSLSRQMTEQDHTLGLKDRIFLSAFSKFLD